MQTPGRGKEKQSEAGYSQFCPPFYKFLVLSEFSFNSNEVWGIVMVVLLLVISQLISWLGFSSLLRQSL